ncbi:unnamed protein product, partial [Laminaria digitata]
GFEGLSGKVELDDSGNRKAADVSFWLMEAATFDGVSYLTGTEAARYACATGKVELLREIDWPAPRQDVRRHHSEPNSESRAEFGANSDPKYTPVPSLDKNSAGEGYGAAGAPPAATTVELSFGSPGLTLSTFLTLPLALLFLCLFLVSVSVAAVVVTARATSRAASLGRLRTTTAVGSVGGVEAAPSSPRTPTPAPTPHGVPSAGKGCFPLSPLPAAASSPTITGAAGATAASITPGGDTSPGVLLDNGLQACVAGVSQAAWVA